MTTKKKSRLAGRPSDAASRPSKIKKSPSKSTLSPDEKESRRLMNRDLKRSDESPADGRKMGCVPLTEEQTKSVTGEYRYSYMIPFLDLDGKPTDFDRIKFTSEPLGAFGIMSKKPRKYYQEPGTTPRIYVPPGFDLKRIADDPSEPLAMTEGEKKAFKGCKSGIPTIAVTGVWAWRSKKKGISAIPDFDKWKWKGRKVWLVFDNDLMTNPLVIGALAALSKELHKRGAKVFIKYLPQGKKNKGLDDYLLRHDTKAFIKLREEPYAASEYLWQLNNRIAFIEKVNAYWDFKYKTMYKTTAFLIQQFADLIYPEPKANGEGFKQVNAADAWSKWEHKRKYDDIGYFPGDEPVVNVDGVDIINTWPDYKCEPREGNVKPFLELLDYLFEGEPVLRAWFEQWLAYPLQNPGEKCLNAVLLHSRRQGVGKSFVGYIMSEIYGDNFNVVSQDELQSAYNDWVVFKQFILGEEITGNNSRREADRLKNMISREQINVSIKYQPGYKLKDCANYLFTSNHVDALHLENSDRRTAVHEITAEPKSEAFYKRVDRWRFSKAGPPALFHYLLNVDLDGFNPKKAPPSTAAKRAMIDASKSGLDLFAEEVLDNADAVLRMGDTVVADELMTLDRITAFANGRPGASNHSPKAVSTALRSAGFRMRIIFTCDGTKRFWAVRNRDAWEKREDKEFANYYERVTHGQSDKLGKER